MTIKKLPELLKNGCSNRQVVLTLNAVISFLESREVSRPVFYKGEYYQEAPENLHTDGICQACRPKEASKECPFFGCNSEHPSKRCLTHWIPSVHNVLPPPKSEPHQIDVASLCEQYAVMFMATNRCPIDLPKCEICEEDRARMQEIIDTLKANLK